MSQRTILAVLLLSAAVGMAADFDHTIVYASVPFEFYIGSNKMPAGDYKAQAISDKMLAIWQPASNVVLEVPCVAAKRPLPTPDSRFVFIKENGRIDLRQIFVANSVEGRELGAKGAKKVVAFVATKRNPAKSLVQGKDDDPFSRLRQVSAGMGHSPY